MKIYLAYVLLITGSLWMTLPIVVVAKPNPTSVKPTVTTARITPTAALERLILAPKLDASWFTPEFLKAADKNSDVNTVQFQRDVSLKLGKMRYGNYKSVQPIGDDRYRIIFDRAEPDAVIAQFYIDKFGRIAGISLVEKRNEPNAAAQVAAQAAVDRSFKTNVGSNGKPNQLFVSLKQWLGNYRKVLKKDASNYLGVFERGSVPVTVNFKPDGSIENFRMGCPVTQSTTVSQAPQQLQKLLANCPDR
ncbi:hypothetical protein [Chamaesiphon minutus]|uniref:Uncharacterized protein n=1 Tax=Chamaesiphon minutus (strain ATCC 27169 / PCC 6605) TaxID=1173020 RepID=K9UMW9_CHAP6|nr:hypothetical protein [Chamaesiphon minutus]AFY96447.1 hypothetical protein Cha6605_5571 [Chamaesiphon minutus PCC 6605]